MKFHNSYRLTVLLGLGMLISLLISGCSLNSGAAKPQDAATEVDRTAGEVKKTTTIYYDFEDVLFPMELSVIKNRTMIISTPGYRSGILTLKGRVESNSLYNFFSNNMEKDNWQVISRIKSPETTIMVFQKTSRCAVITIRDEQIYTYVEVSVAPTMGGAALPKSNNLAY